MLDVLHHVLVIAGTTAGAKVAVTGVIKFMTFVETGLVLF